MTQCNSYNGDPIIPLDTALYNYLNPAGYWYAPGHYMMYPPGDYCKYTNAGIGLAGYFTQVATGDSLPLYCRQHIFEPLGMDHTSWWYSELDTNNVAIQYDYNGVQYVRCYSGRVSHSCYPAGQLKFSAIDLSRFLLAFMQYGRLDTVRILDSTTVAFMRTIQDTVVHGQFVCPIGITWWCWHSPSTGSPVWGHAGRDWGASAVMAYYESLDIGVVILSNGEINSLTELLAGMVPTLVQWAMQHGIAENTIEPANIGNLQVTPNPFAQITDIRYQMTDQGRRNSEVGTTLRIYDATGRLVRDFGPLSVIGHPSSVKWDGRDDQNRMLGSGVYFVKLGSGNFTETKKVLLVR
jgi:CubicO group peptidase (beta-lactamase class C family)